MSVDFDVDNSWWERFMDGAQNESLFIRDLAKRKGFFFFCNNSVHKDIYQTSVSETVHIRGDFRLLVKIAKTSVENHGKIFRHCGSGGSSLYKRT